MQKKFLRKFIKIINRAGILVPLSLLFFLTTYDTALASRLIISPNSGSFSVGETFDISVSVDTEGQSINAISAGIKFPADKIQLVSPKTSLSVISLWTSQPQFNNQTGEIKLQGGIPKGINVSDGMLAKFTFRVKSTGSVIIRFQDTSKVLLNDGLGTDVLSKKIDAVFDLTLPPPAGPIVISDTHPDQSKWYSANNLVLRWENEERVSGYSHVLNKEPIDIPDDISQGIQRFTSFKNLTDGQYFFHIRSLRDSVWGGVTHFAAFIDATPPADFKIDILPSNKTSAIKPIIKFDTTDQLSGFDHFEMKIIPLSQNIDLLNGDQPFFMEVQSPYIVENLDLGSYDVIIRAYDKAGNFREVTEKMVLYGKLLSVSSVDGIKFGNSIFVSWGLFWFLAILFLIALILIFFVVKKHHDEVHNRQGKYATPDKLKRDLEELKKYRNKYGKVIVLLIMLIPLYFGGQKIVLAQVEDFAPASITTFSKNISNEEIFYLGGESDIPASDITIYIRNKKTNETQSRIVTSDNKGRWFYRHDGFLNEGEYIMWTQAKFADFVSPPSAQVSINVEKTAVEVGGSRLSLKSIYLILFILFVVVSGILTYFILHYLHRAKKKHKAMQKEIEEAENIIQKGFAILRNDANVGLGNTSLTSADKQLLESIVRDLETIEKNIIKEVSDISNVENL